MNRMRYNMQMPPGDGGRRCRACPAKVIARLGLMVMVVMAAACAPAPKGRTTAPGVAPVPTYTGPAYLRGTIGSLVHIRPGNEQPQHVSGYGVVVNLNGTGSTTAPPSIRQALINQMKKYGLGSANLHTLDMSPERVLADPNTTVVRIDGLIPPGATKGTRFDLLVSAVDSQTTSLDGGLLWTATLGVNGAEMPFSFIRETATAYGPIYRNPYSPDTTGEPLRYGNQQAIVVAGGTANFARELDLILNQASYSRSQSIADRINERFGRADDIKPLAKPETDQLIKLNIPPRYDANPGELVELVMHLYLQAGPGFEQHQAQQLIEVLRDQPDEARSVRLALESLGRQIVQTLREYYEDPTPGVRLTALQAGAWLQDELASQSLSALAKDLDPAVRTRAAEALVLLPRSLQGARTLKMLLNDPDNDVRIAAYESLSEINDPIVTDGRVIVPNELGTGIKYIIDTVPADRPLVYVTQVGVPRIVIFKPDLGFTPPLLARLWNNRLMLSMSDDQDYMEVFYQPALRRDPDAPTSVQLKAQPDLKTLVYLMGHKPTTEQPEEGLDLTYSRVVNAVYQLCQQHVVEAPIQVVVSPLAKQIADYDDANAPQTRPETSETQPRPDTTARKPLD